MIGSILVALDSTPIAPRVLRVATAIAERFDASLHLFHAISVPPEFPPAAAFASHDDPLPAHLVREAAKEIAALAAGNARANARPPIIEAGDPWRAILAAADRLDVDLIVMGSHLYHWPDRLLGTTAGNVVNRGRRNVFVVHELAGPEAPSAGGART
jgi:nucleotide-binding universal stress UspA family protein